MRAYFVSSKVSLKCAGSLSVEATGSKAAQKEESFKIFCCHPPFPLPQQIFLNFFFCL